MNEITPEQIAEWRALAEAATPGPWRVSARIDPESVPMVWRADAEASDGPVVYDPELLDADAAFIAAARDAVPALLDALDDAEERARATSCELIRQATEGITAERDEANHARYLAEQDRDDALGREAQAEADLADWVRTASEWKERALAAEERVDGQAWEDIAAERDELDRRWNEDALPAFYRAEKAEASLAASMEAHAVTAGLWADAEAKAERLREGIEALADEWEARENGRVRGFGARIRALLGEES